MAFRPQQGRATLFVCAWSRRSSRRSSMHSRGAGLSLVCVGQRAGGERGGSRIVCRGPLLSQRILRLDIWAVISPGIHWGLRASCTQSL